MKLFIAILLCLCLSAQATTYYVRPDGNNSNTGTGNTAGTAFLTIKKMLDSAGSGDTCNITPGDYPQFASYNVATGNSMTINGTNAIMSGEGLFITGSNCVVNSLVFSNITDNFKLGAAITIGTNGHGTIVKNCLFKDSSDKHGIWTLLADNQTPPVISHWNMSANGCVFTNNVFSNIFGGQCFFVAGSNNLTIGNQFYKIRSGDLFIFHGVSNLFTKNICWSGDNPAGGLHPDIMQTYGTDGNVDAPFAPTWGNKFTQNQFWDWKGALAQITVDDPMTNPVTPLRVDGPIVQNNLYVRCGPTNGSVSSIDNPNTQFLNNTFIECGRWVDSSGHVLNFVLYATNILSPSWRGMATNCLVKNNAFIGCGQNTGAGWWNVEYNSVSSNVTDVVGDYNYVVHYNGSFSAKSGFVESHGLNPGTDPLLVSYPSNNFRPMLGSALINAGTNVSAYIEGDFEGMNRLFGSATDIGAYEFDPNLYVHFDFDESTTGRILDVTGYAHNAVQMDSTNFAQIVAGPVGGLAAKGTIVAQIPDASYNYTWYGAITNLGGSGPISKITNGTFAAWVRMETTGERFDSILDAGSPPQSEVSPNLATNSWNIGYGYSDLREGTVTQFVFKVYGNTLTNDLHNPSLMVGWPQLLRDGVTWGHLAAVWNGGGNVILYFNGAATATNALGVPWLGVNTSPVTPWVALNIQTHGGTPQWGDDIYPNYGSLKGSIDDVRLYNRALNAAEVATIYSGVAAASGGGGGDTTNPTITITSPTSSSSYDNGASSSIAMAGTASDDVSVSSVTWVNDRGGSGTASGTTSWSFTATGLSSGVNNITVTATDSSNNTGTDALAVTYTPVSANPRGNKAISGRTKTSGHVVFK